MGRGRERGGKDGGGTVAVLTEVASAQTQLLLLTGQQEELPHFSSNLSSHCDLSTFKTGDFLTEATEREQTAHLPSLLPSP